MRILRHVPEHPPIHRPSQRHNRIPTRLRILQIQLRQQLFHPERRHHIVVVLTPLRGGGGKIHPYHVVVVGEEQGPAGVPRADGGRGLAHDVTVHPAAAADDALGELGVAGPQGEPQGEDLRSHLAPALPQVQLLQLLPGLLHRPQHTVLLVRRQEGQVKIRADQPHPGRVILPAQGGQLDAHGGGVADDVGVGHNEHRIQAHDPPRPDGLGAVRVRLPHPRGEQVGRRGIRCDPHHG
mmetsp:Transcript_2639/g.6200  ORF Transcript_2639/g.6200 Transcript_2639/m.6200 type:complete len:238 (-) Transcript_2639:23-736(-)